MITEKIAKDGIYTSFDVSSKADKKNLFNALNSKNPSIKTLVNKDIEVVGIIATGQMYSDEEKAETKDGWKIVLMLKSGDCVNSSGNAVLQNLDNAVSIFGAPSQENVLKFKVVSNQSGRNSNYQYISLQIV